VPKDLKWSTIFGAGQLAGIGFTMSIFISLLAFETSDIVNNSKIAILVGSILSGTIGYFWLKLSLKPGLSDSSND
jgi:Na+:H+ antiporter, NhaA family